MRVEPGHSDPPTESLSVADSAANSAADSVEDSAVDAQAHGEQYTPARHNGWGKWLVGIAVGSMVVALLWFGPQLWRVAQDEAALEAWVVGLGWWGPLALVALNAVQIVVAPIPGYVVQVAAGFLFGPFWGGVWANVGLVIGATLAFWLARFYGRPLAGRLVGHERLAQWEHVTHSDSTIVWFVLLLGPVGDLPYFLAGLAKVSFAKVMLLTLIIRVPSTFVVTAAGAGVMLLTWWQIGMVFALLFVMVLLFMRYQTQIIAWSDRATRRRVERSLPSETK